MCQLFLTLSGYDKPKSQQSEPCYYEKNLMTQNEINEKEWERQTNWKYFLFYYSEEDTRVWVPKKPKWMGWTLNFAKKQSYIWSFVLLFIPIAILLIIVLLR